jgi:hypothetical protein
MDFTDQQCLEALRAQSGGWVRCERTGEWAVSLIDMAFVHESFECAEQLLSESHAHRSRICRVLSSSTDGIAERMSDE